MAGLTTTVINFEWVACLRSFSLEISPACFKWVEVLVLAAVTLFTFSEAEAEELIASASDDFFSATALSRDSFSVSEAAARFFSASWRACLAGAIAALARASSSFASFSRSMIRSSSA